jgi:hypothetical protein
MTGGAFRIWLVLPLFHLGAFASGIRPARWFGSRLLPLVSVGLPAILAVAVSWWWFVGVPILIASSAILIGDILWVVETRDF